MKKRLVSIILAALMTLSAFAAFASCNNGGNGGVTESDTVESTESGENITNETTEGVDNVTTEQTGEDTTEQTGETTTDAVDGEVFDNGGDVKGAGFTWDDGAFASLEHKINESAAVSISSAELKPLLNSKELDGDEVFILTDALSLDSNTKYYGNGAAVIAPFGIVAENAEEIVIKELVIKGDLVIKNSVGVTLFKVDISGGDCAVAFEGECSNIAFKSCRFSADGTAVSGKADLVSFFECSAVADRGFMIDGDGSAIQNCHVTAVSTGISLTGDSVTVRNCIIETVSDGVGVEIKSGSSNALVALNVIKNSQRSVTVTGGFNCVVLLNSAIRVVGDGNVNLYVVENDLGGRAVLTNNDYLLCDANKASAPIISTNNTNTNGDNLMDVNARLDVGADENLLPHTNKELFVNMERKTKVRDVSITKEYMLNNYIRHVARENSVVIVPPGAYVSGAIALAGAHGGTAIYAYGVLDEVQEFDNIIDIESVSNISVYGLSMGYSFPAAGQVHVIEKLGSNRVRVVASAGFPNDFGKTDPTTYNPSVTDVFFDGKEYPELTLASGYDIEHATDVPGTMILTYLGSAAMQKYLRTGVGTVYMSRLGENKNFRSIDINSATNIKFKDIVLYGCTGGLAAVADGRSKNVTFERWHNTTRAPSIIDEDTYNRYVELEKQYGVDLEVYIDGNGNYRGSTPRVGSVDAVHVPGAEQGISIYSSLFEKMCDDGANQRGNSGRIHEVVDNKDGTTTIFYKHCLGERGYSSGSTIGGICQPFAQGDRVYIYTSKGAVVCDTRALTPSSGSLETIRYTMKYQGKDQQYSAAVFSVTVSTDAINQSALDEYDMAAVKNDNHYDDTYKIYVDNLSRNSAGFTMDNVLVRNTRAGGVVIRTVDVNISSCTFQNLAGGGIVMANSCIWNESSIPQDVTIRKCLFDNIGFGNTTMENFNDFTNPEKAAIKVTGDSTEVGEDRLPATDITIEGCEFVNNSTRYAIYINSAKNVTVRNNVFNAIVNESRTNPGFAVYVNFGMNVNISDNVYKYKMSDVPADHIKAVNYKNVFGTDVTDENGNKLFPDK